MPSRKKVAIVTVAAGLGSIAMATALTSLALSVAVVCLAGAGRSGVDPKAQIED